MNMKGVFLHIVTDFIGSVIVILTASISLWFPDLGLLKLYMDPVLSMCMVVLIMISTIPLGTCRPHLFHRFSLLSVHETALILLQTTPDDVDVKAIEQKIKNTPGVVAVHEFHVWRLVGVKIIATVHIRFQSLDHYMQSAENIRNIFHNHRVHSVTVQPEFAEVLSTCLPPTDPIACRWALAASRSRSA